MKMKFFKKMMSGQTVKPVEWSSVIEQLKRQQSADEWQSVHIPVTKESFENFNKFSIADRYQWEIDNFVKAGYILADARIESNIIRVSYCLDEGDDSVDEDGYGMESRKDITAILDWSGNYVASFTFEGNTPKEFKTIDLLIKLGIPALDEQGKINARYEPTADRWCQKVFIQDLCGMFSFDRLEVPCVYKNVELLDIKDKHGLSYSFCVQTTEDRYGLILPYSNKDNIPAIYYSPFKKVDADVVATTREDGSEVRFRVIEKGSHWEINEM
jgi:hypothetical protein